MRQLYTDPRGIVIGPNHELLGWKLAGALYARHGYFVARRRELIRAGERISPDEGLKELPPGWALVSAGPFIGLPAPGSYIKDGALAEDVQLVRVDLATGGPVDEVPVPTIAQTPAPRPAPSPAPAVEQAPVVEAPVPNITRTPAPRPAPSFAPSPAPAVEQAPAVEPRAIRVELTVVHKIELPPELQALVEAVTNKESAQAGALGRLVEVAIPILVKHGEYLDAVALLGEGSEEGSASETRDEPNQEA